MTDRVGVSTAEALRQIGAAARAANQKQVAAWVRFTKAVLARRDTPGPPV